MLPECGISTQKWTEIREKGQRQSPEIVSRFPEYNSRFPQIVSRFLENVSQFPEIVSRFLDIYDDFNDERY